MTIIRTAHTANYTILNNGIANDETLSGTATAILIYLISKPPHWKFNAHDVKRRFGIGLNKVYRCMRELIAAGYAMYKRTQSAVEWFVYDTPQTKQTATAPAVPDRVNFDCSQNESALETNERLEITRKQQPSPVPPPHIPTVPVPPVPTKVVVSSSDELIFPSQLTPAQKRGARHKLKKLQQPELSQEVLFALAYYMAQGVVKSPVAYLDGIVNRANNGTFTAVQAHTATKSPTAADRAEETRKRLESQKIKIDNASFFEDLKNRFGAKAAAAIPV